MDDLQDRVSSNVNDSGTYTKSDTPLTQPRTPPVHGWTYFIRVGASIKIGSAAHFKRRLHALQTAHEKPIEVLAVVPAAMADEYAVHQRFAGLRMRGEWFRADRELLKFIEELRAEAGLPPLMETATPEQPDPMDAILKDLHSFRYVNRRNVPVANRANIIIQQISNYRSSTDEVQRDWLKAAMAVQMIKLQGLMVA